jgi:hypothetical protein
MPKWTSRIWREVTKIEVRRVQEITIDDIERVGIRDGEEDGFGLGPTAVFDSGTQQFWERFSEFWDRHNKHPEHQWDANPVAWVVTIKEVKA